MRAGEQEGVEYHFCDDKTCASLEAQGKVIELRAYHTVHGIWKYFTADDGQIATDGGNYLYITTLEAYERLRDYYGKEFVVPIYMEVDDGVRLQRALDRERKQKPPKYKEMCRRFLADAEDFSEENLTRAGITERFVNDDLDATARAIWDYMRRIERG
jgi:guanylate kinase